MTLEERLNVMGIESNTNGDVVEYLAEGQIPKTDNLLVLLVQGLQSNDAKMLNVSDCYFRIWEIRCLLPLLHVLFFFFP